MSSLDRVMQLQAQGMTDEDISRKLRDEGVSLSDINDAFGQAKIKEAVSHNPEDDQFSGMEQSIMQNDANIDGSESSQAPSVYQEQSPQQAQYAPEQYDPSQVQYQEQYQGYPQPSQQLDTETITEIASQVVSERFSEFAKKTGDLAVFKNDTQEKLKDFDERLKKIENTIDSIQRAIIGKVGEFGENISNVHKDLENVHDTMSKLMNPLIDNYRELKKIAK